MNAEALAKAVEQWQKELMKQEEALNKLREELKKTQTTNLGN